MNTYTEKIYTELKKEIKMILGYIEYKSGSLEAETQTSLVNFIKELDAIIEKLEDMPNIMRRLKNGEGIKFGQWILFYYMNTDYYIRDKFGEERFLEDPQTWIWEHRDLVSSWSVIMG